MTKTKIREQYPDVLRLEAAMEILSKLTNIDPSFDDGFENEDEDCQFLFYNTIVGFVESVYVNVCFSIHEVDHKAEIEIKPLNEFNVQELLSEYSDMFVIR